MFKTDAYSKGKNNKKSKRNGAINRGNNTSTRLIIHIRIKKKK